MDIYKLEVLEIPTNMPVARADEDDEVYRTSGEKYRAIIAELKDCIRRSRPRNVSRSSPRTRRSPRSRSRTISACTRSWPA
jgi:preprotein translocase subunit SecA